MNGLAFLLTLVAVMGFGWILVSGAHCVVAAGRRRSWRAWLGLCGGSVLLVAGLAGAWSLGRHVARATWQSRLGELELTTRAAQPAIAAIGAYEQARGAPPASLKDLVPRFLPTVPAPGPGARAGWEYSVGKTQGEPEWVLGIAVRRGLCPKCGVSFGDYFMFHPDGRYPRAAYGGILERVGAWGYYHE